MAVLALKSPTTPNVTNTNLVYTLTSDNVNQPQFRYVADIYESGSGDYITTIKTFPNVNESGILDVARELNDQLDYDLNWKTVGSTQPVNTVKTFDIRFGEEYATTLDGTSSLYTGSTSNYLEVFPGNVYKNEGSYNFNTTPITAGSNILTNHPEAVYQPEAEDYIWVNGDDYHTITVLDADASLGINLYDASNIFVSQSVVSVEQFGTIGIGPANLPWALDYNTMGRITVSSLGSPNYSIFLPAYKGHPCGNEYTRFAFINEYGFWDYYNVYNPLRKQTKVERNTYTRPFVRYEDTVARYNSDDRGKRQYYTEYEDTFTISTDYLTQATATWLTELFESPSVYIQIGSKFVPIVITTNSIDWNMNQFRQKLFQYDIQFQLANQPQPR